MSNKEIQRLKRLKLIDLATCTTSFWVVHRKSAQPPFSYAVLRVNIDKKLDLRLKRYFRTQVQDREFRLEAYDFSNADPNESLLTMDAESTDFTKVRAAINNGFDNPRAKSHAELLASFAYVVLFEKADELIYAWSKINTLNRPRQAIRAKALYFQHERLVDVEDEEVFMIDPRFDFFIYAGTAFIASKSAFESSMNFREGMKTKSKELLDEFSAMAFLSDVEPIRAYVGENLHHLRKLASIKNAGYYGQPKYIERLMRVCRDEGWELKIEGGKIVVEAETMDLLLKLLNNDRLRSPINDEVFDSAAKIAVSAIHKPGGGA